MHGSLLAGAEALRSAARYCGRNASRQELPDFGQQGFDGGREFCEGHGLDQRRKTDEERLAGHEGRDGDQFADDGKRACGVSKGSHCQLLPRLAVVRAGVEAATSPRLVFCVEDKYAEVNCRRTKKARPPSRCGICGPSAGSPNA